MNFGERLVKAREYLGYNQSKFSEKLDLAAQSLARYEKNKTKPSMEFVSKLTNMFNINSNWLLTGTGKILLENESSENNSLVAEPKPKYEPSSNNYQIDLLNVRAGAGEGIYNYVIETVDTISLDKSFFRTPINTNKVKGIQVDGDSMEPTLRHGDYVLIDENITFGTNGIYAIQYGGQILIKRLQFKIDGSILIISDNQKYEKEIFNPQENQLPFKVMGIKVLSIQR
ncbi:S24 family peptidase [Halarcobacter sp.]|uniref:XRE family transcriptional regulator n=1 Tax=Halarcobacter sp. TaxID=2321133 RepID=UPI0029F4B5AD|nr:S24 family peptidase [Halarcobacter sp.]